ncbi:hypothetical protein D3C84_1085770 [compost metagenome]
MLLLLLYAFPPLIAELVIRWIAAVGVDGCTIGPHDCLVILDRLQQSFNLEAVDLRFHQLVQVLYHA